MKVTLTLLALSLVFASGCTRCSQSPDQAPPEPGLETPHDDSAHPGEAMPPEDMKDEGQNPSLPPADSLDQELPPEEALPDNPGDEDLSQ